MNAAQRIARLSGPASKYFHSQSLSVEVFFLLLRNCFHHFTQGFSCNMHIVVVVEALIVITQNVQNSKSTGHGFNQILLSLFRKFAEKYYHILKKTGIELTF